MKKIAALVVLALVAFGAYYFLSVRNKPKEEVPQDLPLAVSRHSVGFNNSMTHFLNAYYNVSESLVNWDSTNLNVNAQAMHEDLKKIDWAELSKDSVIGQTAQSYIEVMEKQSPTLYENTTLENKRRAFHAFSQNLYDLLRTIKYDGAKVYLQQCPMAFNDTEEGWWLSKSNNIRNPYLGLHHPKYSSGMLNCGETKDSISFATIAK